MTQDQAIDLLNSHVKLRIAPSSIHGIGVFAIRDIPKGARLNADLAPIPYKVPYSSFNKLFPEIRELLLERWPQIVNGSAFCYPDVRLQAYMNHSEEPNYDARTDIVLKDITKGEEVTEDYRLINGYAQVYPWLTKGV